MHTIVRSGQQPWRDTCLQTQKDSHGETLSLLVAQTLKHKDMLALRNRDMHGGRKRERERERERERHSAPPRNLEKGGATAPGKEKGASGRRKARASGPPSRTFCNVAADASQDAWSLDARPPWVSAPRAPIMIMFTMFNYYVNHHYYHYYY